MKNQVSFSFDPRLDQAQLTDLYEDDVEHALMVFEQFLKTCPSLVTEMQENFNAGIVEPFRKSAHKIKPVFSFAGLTGLTAMAEIIEKKCEQIQSLKEIEVMFQTFITGYQEGYAIIQKEVKSIEEYLN